VRYISGLIALINEQNAAGDAGAPALSSAVAAHFHNTLGMTISVLFFARFLLFRGYKLRLM